MSQAHPSSLAIAAMASLMLLTSGACEREQAAEGVVVKPQAAANEHGHDHDHDHDHATGEEHAHEDHGHGAPISLGEQTAGAFALKATRDEGEIIAGKDCAIDVTITSADAAAPGIAAVRFWIGTQDARGSVKARAEIENQSEPNRWHTHAEIPSPLPEGSTLWVEIETDSGEKLLASFKIVP